MTLRVLNKTDIGDLDKLQVKAALKSAFAGLTTGASVQPTQTITDFPSGEGDAIFYPGALWDASLVGVKISPYLSGLARSGKTPVTAYTLLLSTETGEPVLLCDSLALTTVRTAATTSLALDYLIPQEASRLAVIGGGQVALEHLDYVLNQHVWSEVSIFSPSLADPDSERHEVRTRQLRARFGDIVVASSAADAVRDADVVLLCTSSGTPVVDSELLSSARVITSISTNVPRAHEIDPRQLHQFDVFCDYRQTAPMTAGDFVLAANDHGWTPSTIVADLPELVTGAPFARTGSRPRYFRSTGLGIEDLAVASQLL